MNSLNGKTLRPLNGTDSAIDHTNIWLLSGFAAQIPLVYTMRHSAEFATYLAIALVVLGIWFLLYDHESYRLVYLTGYIMGLEVVWRMSKASVFWEFGKYAVGFLLILALVKRKPKLQGLPLLYFALLLPSAALTVADSSLWEARRALSFNLSGPFLLMVSVLFFSQVRMSDAQFRRLLLFCIMPITGIAFLATFSTITTSEITFGSQSNFIASGGYGPNQVSALLGLGALLCWLFFATEKHPSSLSWLVIGLLIWFLSQAFLTFSRGGLANFFGAAFCATLFLGRGRQLFDRHLWFGLILCALFAYIILPWLNDFTGGRLENRFADITTTGRAELVKTDLKLWEENLVLGVGPGNSGGERQTVIGAEVAPHTEFSRMLAEHGLLGFCALITLLVMAVRLVWQAPTPEARGIILALLMWAVLEMSHSAMRLAAISYVFSLPFIKLRR